MEVGLSHGAVAAISEQGDRAAGLRPVLQVAHVQLLGSPRGVKWYRMLLSDGVHCLQGILASNMNHLVEDGGFRRGTVLRLLQYMCHTIRNRRMFIFIQFEILHTDCLLIGTPKLYESGQDTCVSSTALRPAEKGANKLTDAGHCGESRHADQGMEAELVRKTVAQINELNLGCSDNQELFTVKATLSFINTENFCYTACPLVVNGRQCRMEVASSGDGWWYCHSCNQTFVTCDYRYRIFIQLQDSTGATYAPASQAAGEDIFGCTAKKLYSMKYEKQDCAQFDNIVVGVLFRDYIFKVKLKAEAFGDKIFPKCTIIKAEKVNPCIESRHLLRVINKLLQENSGSNPGNLELHGRYFSYLDARARHSVRSFRSGYGMNLGGAWDLPSQTGSNSL